MKNYFILLFMSCFTISYGQQVPQSNTYLFNKYSFNPAYVGMEKCTQISASHLNQWLRIEGAPATSLFNASTSIGKHFGAGGQLLIDKIGMLQQFSGMGTISYGFNIQTRHEIRIGASIGYNQYRLNPSSAVVFDPLDPIVNGGNQSSGVINTDIGVTYRFEQFELGISTKQLIHSFSNFGYTNLPGYGLKRHAVGYAAYTIPLSKTWDVQPSLLMKGINNVMQVDINSSFIYKKNLHLGLSYRTQVGLIGRIGIQLKDRFLFAYAYEAPMANIASYSAGSHELIMSLRFCKNPRERQEKISRTPIHDTIVKIVYQDIYHVDTLNVSTVDTIYIKEKSENKEEILSTSIEKTIYFEFDRALIEKESMGAIEGLINILLQNQKIIIYLDGHTDAIGDLTYNEKLSKDRVDALKDLLLMNGVAVNRIKCNYHGESKPKSSNIDQVGRAANRRVDIRLIQE
jgi:type IX secretion system PorP/SprF family membrane protein